MIAVSHIMDNAQLRVMKKKKNKKIASLDKKNKNFCHLGKRGCLIKNAKAWKKRHKNRQMMEHKIILLVRVNVFNSTHPTKRNFSIIICFMLFAELLHHVITHIIVHQFKL